MSPETLKGTSGLEALKEQYRQKLDAILYRELTVESIDTFADEALNDLIALNEEILDQSKVNPSFQDESVELQITDREREDFVYQKLELPDIQEILGRISDVRDRIENIKDYIDHHKQLAHEVITPPQEHGPRVEKGSGEGLKEAFFVPRLLTLMYLLESDFDIKKEDVQILEGEVTPHMMRETPYIRVEIPDLQRVVYICEEEENASYIFDSQKLQELGIRFEELDIDDKGEKNALIVNHPGVGVRVTQTRQWRRKMSQFLSAPISEQAGTSADIRTSEFLEKKEWLLFEEFQREVQSAYPGKGTAFGWYMTERKNHTHWPSNPNDTYKGKGWQGWSHLVGRENIYKKKEALPFSDFQTEVRRLYPGTGSVGIWYGKEKKNHRNWPSYPEIEYKGKGWIGWAELVGRQSHLKKEFLSFDELQKEVEALYDRSTNIGDWYRAEKKKHPKWPSDPAGKYKDRGWTSWKNLINSEQGDA